MNSAAEPLKRCRFCLQPAQSARLSFSNLENFYSTFRSCGLGLNVNIDARVWVCAYCWTRASQCVRFVECARAAEQTLSTIGFGNDNLQVCQFYKLTLFRLENTEHAKGYEKPALTAPQENPYLRPTINRRKIKVARCAVKSKTVKVDLVKPLQRRRLADENEDDDDESSSSSDADSDTALGSQVYSVKRDGAVKHVRKRRGVMRDLKGGEKLRMLFMEPVRLSLEEQHREMARKLTSAKYLRGKFRCDKCGATHSEQEMHVAHVERWHRESAGEYECEICHYRFENQSHLNHHSVDHMRRWRCLRCGLTIARRNYCGPHYAKCVGSSPARCHMCGRIFLSDFQLRRHLQRAHAKNRVYLCTECTGTFRFCASLKSHVQQIHRKERPYQCEICGKRSSCLSVHNSHLKTHERPPRESETYCEGCDRLFKRPSSLRYHLRHSLRHNTKDSYPQVCSVCSKRFRSQTYLQHHIRRVHLKVKTHACGQCDKSYYNAPTLAAHVKSIHQGARTRDHVCTECGKTYLTKNHLQNHVVAVHKKQRPYACADCGATFGFRSTLFTHRKLKHNALEHRALARPS